MKHSDELELVQDGVAGMFDELAETRDMVDRRYDEVESGRVKLIDGEEAFARLHEKIEERRSGPALMGAAGPLPSI